MPKQISWHHRHTPSAGIAAATQKHEGHLGSHRVTRFLSDSLSTIANKLAAIVKTCFHWLISKLAWERKEPFRDYFNFSWKRSLPSQAADWENSEKAFATHYEGNRASHVARRNYQAAKQFLREVACDYSESDRQAVETLISQRRILNEMTQLLRKPSHEEIKSRTQEVVQHLQKRCDTLSAPRSCDVVHVKNSYGDYTSFPFPGGHRKHYLTFEAQYHPNTGDYFFIIHNRGQGNFDTDLHGALALRTSDGTLYKRTSVKLKVSLEQLKNPELLGGLYKKMWSANNIEKTYKVIKKHLLAPDLSNIIMSPQEKKWLEYTDKLKKYQHVIDKYAKAANLTVKEKEQLARARSHKEDLKPKMKTMQAYLIKKDPAFHSLQAFGTCTESNSSSPEKTMASASVRRELKLFTIDQLAKEVSSLIFLTEAQQRDRNLALKHYQERSEQLVQKIEAS